MLYYILFLSCVFEKPPRWRSSRSISVLFFFSVGWLLCIVASLFDSTTSLLILYSVAEVPDSGLMLDAKLSKHRLTRFSLSISLSLNSVFRYALCDSFQNWIGNDPPSIKGPTLSWPFPSFLLSSGVSLLSFFPFFSSFSKCIPWRRPDSVRALRNPRPKTRNGFDLFFFLFFSSYLLYNNIFFFFFS